MSNVTILIPTKDRLEALVATLTSLLSQTYTDFSIIISDQSQKTTVSKYPTIQTLTRIFALHNNPISFHINLPRQGLAQQRDYLLCKSTTPYSLFLDDDCILEPYVLKNLVDTIEREACGFVGQAVIGLSYRDDIRPNEQYIEFWETKVEPETIKPLSEKWQRHVLHNAANILHIQEKLHNNFRNPKTYKVAWVGGCVLYDTKKLLDVGGFSFWKDLPKNHAGEDVLVQIRVMEKYGGCGIIPSGVYHQELPTTVKDRTVNAPEYFTNI